MQTRPLRMDGQGPTVEHRDPYPVSWDKPKRKRILKEQCLYVYNEPLCYTAEIGATS